MKTKNFRCLVMSGAIAMLLGCRAHMMETHGDQIILFQTGPDKPAKGGVIRYLTTGLASWRTARRTDAERQMTQFCGGGFSVVDEGPRSKFGSSMPIGKSVTFEVDEYWYIRFACQPPTPR